MIKKLKKVIFIDRDGTIIREPDDEQIDSLEKLEFVAGAITSLAALMGRGYELVLVSNQDGLGTDSFPEDTFWPAHNKMITTLRGEGVEFDNQLIDRSFPEDNSPNRKPGTGMLGAYMTGEYDLGASYVIGDRATDIELACNLGAKGIFLGCQSNSPEKADFSSESWEEIAQYILKSDRIVRVDRQTSETKVHIEIDLDGNGDGDIDTGLKFFDHMLMQIPHHSGVSLKIRCDGDLEVDEHHTMEDVAITLGEAVDSALGSKMGTERYGFALPMDESRALVLLDFGGRAAFRWDVCFTREYVGDTPTEMYEHFFKSLSDAMHCNLHIEARGDNNHHLIESVFKAFARALKMAIRRNPLDRNIPSSKGLLK